MSLVIDEAAIAYIIKGIQPFLEVYVPALFKRWAEGKSVPTKEQLEAVIKRYADLDEFDELYLGVSGKEE